VQTGADAPRKRVPAAERREELIAAAVHEFAHGGLHGTPVERVARRVGVAQPYVFSLFPSKLELFLAALERSFEAVADTFRRAAEDFARGRAPKKCDDALAAMGDAYKKLLASDRDLLMLQHQCYAACDDEEVRARVRRSFAQLVELARELSGADSEQLDDFFRHGMALNVAAALGVDDLSSTSAWVKSELRRAPAAHRGPREQ
jgi:AcrR family transcriptional regulator